MRLFKSGFLFSVATLLVVTKCICAARASEQPKSHDGAEEQVRSIKGKVKTRNSRLRVASSPPKQAGCVNPVDRKTDIMRLRATDSQALKATDSRALKATDSRALKATPKLKRTTEELVAALILKASEFEKNNLMDKVENMYDAVCKHRMESEFVSQVFKSKNAFLSKFIAKSLKSKEDRYRKIHMAAAANYPQFCDYISNECQKLDAEDKKNLIVTCFRNDALEFFQSIVAVSQSNIQLLFDEAVYYQAWKIATLLLNLPGKTPFIKVSARRVFSNCPSILEAIFNSVATIKQDFYLSMYYYALMDGDEFIIKVLYGKMMELHLINDNFGDILVWISALSENRKSISLVAGSQSSDLARNLLSNISKMNLHDIQGYIINSSNDKLTLLNYAVTLGSFDGFKQVIMVGKLTFEESMSCVAALFCKEYDHYFLFMLDYFNIGTPRDRMLLMETFEHKDLHLIEALLGVSSSTYSNPVNGSVKEIFLGIDAIAKIARILCPESVDPSEELYDRPSILPAPYERFPKQIFFVCLSFLNLYDPRSFLVYLNYLQDQVSVTASLAIICEEMINQGLVNQARLLKKRMTESSLDIEKDARASPVVHAIKLKDSEVYQVRD